MPRRVFSFFLALVLFGSVVSSIEASRDAGVLTVDALSEVDAPESPVRPAATASSVHPLRGAPDPAAATRAKASACTGRLLRPPCHGAGAA